MRPRTIHPTDCGNCLHWHEWSEHRHKEYWGCYKNWQPGDLAFGDCDKIDRGTLFSDGENRYDGYSFEDENYDEEFNCFEGREKLTNG